MRRWLVGALLAVAPLAHAADRTRWVVAVGSHVGGPGTEKLRHASDDALSVLGTLLDLGGVTPDRAVMLDDPTLADLRDALDTLTRRLGEAKARGEQPDVVFYYSGHSDDRGLTPYGEVLPWSELRQRLAGLPADLRIAVIDACASGALVRSKGGVHTEGFLQDRTNVVSGAAFITSASADEAAQESDRLGGSFFTHHLVAGLRGAADRDEDGRVTLDEAYGYAYDQTLRHTEQTWNGPQHPNRDVDLSGRGDVVLTDLRDRSARMLFDERLDGTISIRDGAGDLVAELYKGMGTTLAYALPPGDYVVRLWARDTTFKARVVVRPTEPTRVLPSDLVAVADLAHHRIRGPVAPTWTRTHPANFQLAPYLGSYGFARDIRTVGVAWNAFGALHPELRGWGLGLWSATTGDLDGVDMQGAVTFAAGRVRGWQVGTVTSAGSLAGLQGGVVNHVAGDVRGAQLGVVSYAEGGLGGLQGSLLANVARGRSATGIHGVQLSGLVNVGTDGQVGMQGSTVNVSGTMRGLQLGVVNVTTRKLRGMQVGLVNVARELDGEALGILNVIGNGYHAVEVGTDPYSPISLGLKLGSRHLYTRIGLGFDPTYGTVGTAVSLGLGGHGAWGRFQLDGDGSAVLPERAIQDAFTTSPPGLDFRFQLTPAVTLTKELALYAGPTLGLGLDFAGADTDPQANGNLLVPSYVVPGGPQGGVLRLWAGYHAGLRVAF